MGNQLQADRVLGLCRHMHRLVEGLFWSGNETVTGWKSRWKNCLEVGNCLGLDLGQDWECFFFFF